MRTIILLVVALAIPLRVMADEQSAGIRGTSVCNQIEKSLSYEPSQTVWDLADLTTGPIPTIGEFLGRTPIIGDFIPAPRMTMARTYVPLIILFHRIDLIGTLRSDRSYSEDQRKEIEETIDVGPRFFDTGAAFKRRLMNADNTLAMLEQNACYILDDPGATHDFRARAIDILTVIVPFRAALGVPSHINAIK